MFPEGTLFNVIYEANSGKVHVCKAVAFYNGWFSDIAGFRSTADRTLEGHRFRSTRRRIFVYGPGELGRAEDVGHEGVVVETPDSVGAGWFECIC